MSKSFVINWISRIPLLILIGPDVGIAVRAVVISILARVHHVWQPGTGPATVGRNWEK